MIDKYLTKICKLIYLHPLFVNLWIQLGEGLSEKIENNKNIRNKEEINDTDLLKYLIDSYLIVKELTKHGYAYRSDIVANQKKSQKIWVFIFYIIFHLNY